MPRGIHALPAAPRALLLGVSAPSPPTPFTPATFALFSLYIFIKPGEKTRPINSGSKRGEHLC